MATRARIVRAVTPPGNEEVIGPGVEELPDHDFDEATYLRAFPDIADAVRRGMLASGLAHYRQAGRAEMRLEKPEYRALLETYAGQPPPQVRVDTLTISTSGSTLMTGWSDDRLDQLVEISLETRTDTRHNWTAFPRMVRTDVDRTLDATAGHRFGFLLVAAPVGGSSAPTIDPRAANAPIFRFASGVEAQSRRDPAVASDADLRDLALAALPSASTGEFDPAVIFAILDQHVGVQIAAINRLIIEQARTRRIIERFGPERSSYRGSVISTLRGGADQIVPRLVLAGTGAGADEYEHIVTITHPEQFEPAMRAARIAQSTLGVSLTLVLQPSGDPAAMGDDSAADVARSGRLIFMDQAVLPRDPDWAARHTALVDGAHPLQTRLFGGLLHRPDGAISQAGYYFDRETSFVTPQQDTTHRVATIKLKTMTHPAGFAGRLPPARAVTGVPAAFMSVDRAWFETLGGFTRHYSRGVYDDIDLCLRSLRRGVPAWVHPLPFWLLERRQPPRGEPSKGGAILNSWLLHRQWDEMIVPDLLGPTPSLPV
jgi:hypothetical protein